MIERFIEYLRAQLGCIYVWGAQGEVDISEAWIRRRETSGLNAERAIALWEKRKLEGMSPIAAYDCSGLIVEFLLDSGLIRGDMSSRGLYAACEKLAVRASLKKGDLVFRHNGEKIYHVGVYIGDGLVIEAKGRDDGVVMRDIDDSGRSYWNRYGRLALISGKTEEKPTQEETLPALYRYDGASYVNIRRAPNTEAEAIGRLSRNESAIVLGFSDVWAEIIKKEDRYLRGWCTAVHLEREQNQNKGV